MTPAHTMKPKFSAAALKAMALEGRLSACEMRAFAARHAATLDADNHADFVEAFLVQLGAPEQHARILELLATCGRDFHLPIGHSRVACSSVGHNNVMLCFVISSLTECMYVYRAPPLHVCMRPRGGARGAA